MMNIDSLLGALLLAAVHLFASNLRFLDVIPRSRWLSIAGGVAVSYALVHLLPELQVHHHVLQEFVAENPLASVDHLIWVIVLLGLVAFYGLEKAVLKAKEEGKGDGGEQVFRLHIASYGIYNALIGYLLVREDRDVQSLILFVVGIGLHFVVNDHGLRHHHKEKYRRIGRWVLSGAIFLGWVVGVTTEVHEAGMACVIAFLAGGILLNTFKEELPEERQSRFWAFVLGAFGYAGILLLI